MNWLEKRLQISNQNGGGLNFPPLAKYECIPFKWIIVATDPDALTYGKIPIDNLSLLVTIADVFDDATPLAQYGAWTKDLTEQSFYGELDLNTPAMNTFLGSSAQTQAKFSIILTEGTARTEIWQSDITIRGSVVAPAYTSPDPLTRYLSADEIESQFVKFYNAPGRDVTFVSPSNLKARTIGGVTDGGSFTDTVLDV